MTLKSEIDTNWLKLKIGQIVTLLLQSQHLQQIEARMTKMDKLVEDNIPIFQSEWRSSRVEA